MNKYIVAIDWVWHGGCGHPLVDELRVLVVEDIDCLSADVLAKWNGIPCPIRTIEAEDGFHAGIAYLTTQVETRAKAEGGCTWGLNRMVVDADGDCVEYVPISGIWIKEEPQ